MSIGSIKKKDKARELIQKNKMIFKCPVCARMMVIDDFGCLMCNSKHSFDLSRKGYLNLLTANNTPVYTKELFEARHKVCEAGFYDPLIDELAQIINEYKESRENKKMNILDAGCGEGSHINSILGKVSENPGSNYVGVDISKDSINIAARNVTDIIWCVADLAKLPFQNGSFDIVLNILSPANYSEFDRILDDKGIVIKVIPGPKYLTELREIIYRGRNDSVYSNVKVIDHFGNKLDVKDVKNINYKFEVDKHLLPHFIKMTPLAWEKNRGKSNEIYETHISSITVDLTIVIGRKKS